MLRHHLYVPLLVFVMLVHASMVFVEPVSTPSRGSAGMERVLLLLLVELLFVALYWVDIMLHCVWLGPRRYFEKRWNITYLIVVLLQSADVAIALSLVPFDTTTIHFSRPLRLFLIVFQVLIVINMCFSFVYS